MHSFRMTLYIVSEMEPEHIVQDVSFFEPQLLSVVEPHYVVVCEDE